MYIIKNSSCIIQGKNVCIEMLGNISKSNKTEYFIKLNNGVLFKKPNWFYALLHKLHIKQKKHLKPLIHVTWCDLLNNSKFTSIDFTKCDINDKFTNVPGFLLMYKNICTDEEFYNLMLLLHDMMLHLGKLSIESSLNVDYLNNTIIYLQSTIDTLNTCLCNESKKN